MKVRFEKGNKVSPVEELPPAEALSKAHRLAESSGRDVTIVTYDEKRKVFYRQRIVSPYGVVRVLAWY